MSVEKALVVDDSKSARVMLGRLLNQSGVQTSFAHSADEAFVMLEHLQPDMVFMDHMMPGMDGISAMKAIHLNEKTAHLPIVMYTSKEGEEYVTQAKSQGARGVLLKPAKKQVVVSVLREINEHLKASDAADHWVTAEEEQTDSSNKVPVAPQSLPQTPKSSTEKGNEQLYRLIEQQTLATIRSVLQPATSDIKTALIAKMLDAKRRDILENFKRLEIEPVNKNIESNSMRLNDLSKELQQYREALEQLDSRSLELDELFSEHTQNSLSKIELHEELESIKDYIHKEVVRQIHPLEAGLKSKLHVIDRSRNEHRHFVNALVEEVATHLEVRALKQATRQPTTQVPLPQLPSQNNRHLVLVLFSVFVSCSAMIFVLIQNFQ